MASGACVHCGQPVYCRDRCQRHYNQGVRNGTLALDKGYHDPKPPQECSVVPCGRNIRNDKNAGHGMCGMHYQRFRKHGDPLYEPPPGRTGREQCEFVGENEVRCTKTIQARDYCAAHLKRLSKHGDPTIVLKPDFSSRPASRPKGVPHGSKHWSCGHAHRCACADSTGRCVACGLVIPKAEFPGIAKPYVSTQCRKCLAAIKRDRRTHPETAERERQAKMRSYRNLDPALRRLRSKKYAHLRSNLPGSFTDEELRELWGRYGGLCGYCGEREATDLDHIIPAILHGMEAEQGRLRVGPPTNNIDNLMPACTRCNSQKGSRTVEQWRNNEPMVRRGDIEYPVRLHKRMRGPRDETIELYERILELVDQGLSGLQVAERLGTHPAYVTKARQWAGRPPAPYSTPVPKEAVQRIFALSDEGLGPQRIAARLTAEGVPTARGGAVWSSRTVYTIVLRRGEQAHDDPEDAA